MLVAIGPKLTIYFSCETRIGSFHRGSDKFERTFILSLGKRKHLFIAAALSIIRESYDDRIITDILQLQVKDRREYRSVQTGIFDHYAVDLRFIEISIIRRMRRIIDDGQSEIGERSLIECSRDAAQSSSVNHSCSIAYSHQSFDIRISFLAGTIMKFFQRAENLAWHEDPDGSDIVECRHDIVPPIIAILIDPGFSRNKLISEIP